MTIDNMPIMPINPDKLTTLKTFSITDVIKPEYVDYVRKQLIDHPDDVIEAHFWIERI